jgi:hypothetical protein
MELSAASADLGIWAGRAAALRGPLGMVTRLPSKKKGTYMKLLLKVMIGGSLLALAACGGQGDDALGDNVADAADAKADTLDAMADNATNEAVEENLEDQADAVREAGEAKEEAIDDADVVVNNQ